MGTSGTWFRAAQSRTGAQDPPEEPVRWVRGTPPPPSCYLCAGEAVRRVLSPQKVPLVLRKHFLSSTGVIVLGDPCGDRKLG